MEEFFEVTNGLGLNGTRIHIQRPQKHKETIRHSLTYLYPFDGQAMTVFNSKEAQSRDRTLLFEVVLDVFLVENQ